MTRTLIITDPFEVYDVRMVKQPIQQGVTGNSSNPNKFNLYLENGQNTDNPISINLLKTGNRQRQTHQEEAKTKYLRDRITYSRENLLRAIVNNY